MARPAKQLTSFPLLEINIYKLHAPKSILLNDYLKLLFSSY